MTLQPLPILYTFRRCPYAMRARMAIAVAGVPVRQIEVALRAKPEALLRASPKGTVPVLVMPNGTVVEQSLEIMRWALQQNDPDGWLRNDALAVPLITENDGEFKVFLDKYKYANRHPELPLAAHRENAFAFLHKLGLALQQQRFLQGDNLSAVDIAIMPFVRQCAQVDRDWFNKTAIDALNTWLCKLEQSALFAQIMTKNEEAR
jgi:glutathione S-transferase